VKRKKMTDEVRAARERSIANAEELRRLAERAQAELERKLQERESARAAAWASVPGMSPERVARDPIGG
jgi:hypothetical protein